MSPLQGDGAAPLDESVVVRTVILRLSKDWVLDLNSPEVKNDGLRVWLSGESGAGKSFACALILEQFIMMGWQIVVLDMHGEYSSLWAHAPHRIQRMGYGTELHEVDDVDPALALVKAGQSLLIDLSGWADIETRKLDVFLLNFLKGLYRLRRDSPGKTLLVLEEAQTVAPQAQSKGQMDNVKLVTSIITGGRKFGLDVLVTSQRISLVDYNIPRSCNVRVLLRVADIEDYARYKPYLPAGSPIHFNGKTKVDGVLVSLPREDNITKFRNGEAIVTSRWFEDARVQLDLPTIHPRKRSKAA